MKSDNFWLTDSGPWLTRSTSRQRHQSHKETKMLDRFVKNLATPSSYKDFFREEQPQQDNNNAVDFLSYTTVYVGNLSFYTTEEQIYELFSKCGEIRRIIMGLDRLNKTPCGFCFVEYYKAEDARDALKYVNGSRLDERVVRCDLDPGFKDGRQFGRGKSGGQVRDEYRQDYDPGRGGWGKQRIEELERRRHYEQRDNYEAISHIPEGSSSKKFAIRE